LNEVANGLQAYRLTGFNAGWRLPLAVSMAAAADRSIYVAAKFRVDASQASTSRVFGISPSATTLNDGSSIALNSAGLICPSESGALIASHAVTYADGTWITALYKVELRAAGSQDRGRLWFEPDSLGTNPPNASSAGASVTLQNCTGVLITPPGATTLHLRAALVMEATDLASELTDAASRAMVGDLEGYIAGLSGGSNAAPVVTTTGTALAYSEGEAAAVIDAFITVTDADSANLTGATIQITSGGQAGADVLSFTNQLGITGTWTAGTFTLALSGTTTVENYQTALRAVRYQNTSQAPTFADRIVTFTANDGTATGSGTRSIQVYTDNDAPVVNVQAGNMTYATGSGAVAIAPTLTVTDVDSANLTSAYVQITSGYASSEDLLAFTNQLGITGSWDSVTGSITLTGTTTVENYQTALRSITYQNSNASPGSLARSVNFRVTDPSNVNGSDTKNIDITITAVPTFTFDTTDILRNLSNEAQPNLTGVPYRVYSVSTGTLVASGTTTTTGTGRLANMTPSGIVTGTTYLLIFGDLATGPLGWMRKAAS
jgi:hypothetical protein